MLIVRYSDVFITLDAVTFAVCDNDHKGNCSDGQEEAQIYTQNHVN